MPSPAGVLIDCLPCRSEACCGPRAGERMVAGYEQAGQGPARSAGLEYGSAIPKALGDLDTSSNDSGSDISLHLERSEAERSRVSSNWTVDWELAESADLPAVRRRQSVVLRTVRQRKSILYRLWVTLELPIRRVSLVFVVGAWCAGVACSVYVLIFGEPHEDVCNMSRTEPVQYDDRTFWYVSRHAVLLNSLQATTIGPLSAYLLIVAPRSFLLCYMLSGFAQAWLFQMMWMCALGNNCLLGKILFVPATAAWLGYILATPWLVARSVGILERSMLRNVGSKRLVKIVVLLAVYAFAILAAGIAVRDSESELFYDVWSCLMWTAITGLLGNAALAIHAISRARALVIVAERLASGPQERAAASSARRVCWEEKFAIVVGPGFMPIRWIFQLRFEGVWPFEPLPDHDSMVRLWYWGIPDCVEVLGNALAALILTGFFAGAFSGERAASEEGRRQKRLAAIVSYRPSEHDEWQQKVEDLANRGISLKALLLFYEGLGKQYMPKWDPRESTTNDVVRQAIIPMSRKTGVALATSLMRGQPTRPNAMISHNWGNKFRDLIAAVVSDAIEDDTYEWAARMLDEDLDRLRQMLRKAGVLQRTYWICAFAVAQHYGICGMVPQHDVDSVTGIQHPACTCGFPKYFNDTGPRRADGKSIPCEMNKFDDMIKYLGASDPEFAQVIAVDIDFKVFSRAWVLAEIAAAFWCGLEQSMKLGSTSSLEAHREFLQSVKIEDMQASRPEDVEEILATIPDKEAFNMQMQFLIFGSLIAKWASHDLTHRLRGAGRFVRMHDTRSVTKKSDSTL